MNRSLAFTFMVGICFGAVRAHACPELQADGTVSTTEIEHLLSQVAYMSPLAGNEQIEICYNGVKTGVTLPQLELLSGGLRDVWDGLPVSGAKFEMENVRDHLAKSYLALRLEAISVSDAILVARMLYSGLETNELLERFVTSNLARLTWDDIKAVIETGLRDVFDGAGFRTDLEQTRDRIIKAWIERP